MAAAASARSARSRLPPAFLAAAARSPASFAGRRAPPPAAAGPHRLLHRPRPRCHPCDRDKRRRAVASMPRHQAVDLPTSATPAWLAHRADPARPSSGPGEGTPSDWVPAVLPALSAAAAFAPPGQTVVHPLRVLVLYGTLRPAGFSKLLAFECARLVEGLGADVRAYDPAGLPVRDPELSEGDKVRELRALVQWSEAHIWVGAELHGNLCSVLKNQVDWIPLNTASVRPTQGKSVALFQVNGGSQSFNAVNTLRLLARWMRMPCVVNQSSVPKAWTQFDGAGRMKESSLRERVVDVCEEFYKVSLVNREFADAFVDRYSERKEREERGRLLTQAEKEAEAAAAALKAKANE